MAEKSNISWTDSTINFWEGCTKVSDGCKNCYAEARDRRMMIEPVIHWGKGAPRRKSKSAVGQALAMNRKPWICDRCGQAFAVQCVHNGCNHPDWAKEPSFHRRRIFSLSLGDAGDKEVPMEWFNEMWVTIDKCRDVIWIICTKRCEEFLKRWLAVCKHWGRTDTNLPDNVIMLTSVENQDAAEDRIPQLLRIPANRRGLSLEPLLGPVDLTKLCADESMGVTFNCLTGFGSWNEDRQAKPLDWLIIGGESGPGARACEVKWIRSLKEQGKKNRIATFVKQLGANVPMEDTAEPLIDKKGADMIEFPADLRVREWPKGF